MILQCSLRGDEEPAQAEDGFQAVVGCSVEAMGQNTLLQLGAHWGQGALLGRAEDPEARAAQGSVPSLSWAKSVNKAMIPSFSC